MRIFILDNYDSFTMNVYHLFSHLSKDIIVKRADKTDLSDIEKSKPDLIIISPGPGKPEEATLSLQAIERFKEKTPVFGICLGMQCMAVWNNGVVEKTTPMHGKKDLILNNKKSFLFSLPEKFYVARYHSLFVSNPGKDFEVIATNKEGIPMAMVHKKLKLFAVQFHPESFLTQYGREIAENVVKLCN